MPQYIYKSCGFTPYFLDHKVDDIQGHANHIIIMFLLYNILHIAGVRTGYECLFTATHTFAATSDCRTVPSHQVLERHVSFPIRVIDLIGSSFVPARVRLAAVVMCPLSWLVIRSTCRRKILSCPRPTIRHARDLTKTNSQKINTL